MTREDDGPTGRTRRRPVVGLAETYHEAATLCRIALADICSDYRVGEPGRASVARHRITYAESVLRAVPSAWMRGPPLPDPSSSPALAGVIHDLLDFLGDLAESAQRINLGGQQQLCSIPPDTLDRGDRLRQYLAAVVDDCSAKEDRGIID